MASEVFFTSNPSDYGQLEGLYINEKDPPAIIEGVSLSTVGIGGRTVRGPSGPQEIDSAGRFLEVYGGRDFGAGGALVNQVWAALLNKPFGSIVVERVAASDAVAATDTAAEGATSVLDVNASSVGEWGNSITYDIEDASNGEARQFNLRVNYLGTEVLYENLNIDGAGVDNLDEVVGDDIGRLVTLVKVADGRPDNATGTALTTGDEGTVANTDYTAVVTSLANYQGIALVLMAGDSEGFQSDVNGQIVTEAASAVDRSFLCWSGTYDQTPTQDRADFTTDITSTSDRIWWCYNSAYTRDPETGLDIQRPPTEWMATIIANTDVDIHPGSREASQFLSGIRRVANETLTRAQLISQRDQGISTLERLPGRFQFRSAVTADLTTGKTEITRRRMADFLQLSAAETLVDVVKAKNTVERRVEIRGLLEGFSAGLQDAGRVIEEFDIVQEPVNTANDRALGIEKVFWRVKLIGHILSLVLETEIGTTVTITES